MPSVQTRKDAQRCGRLEFCYLCGESIAAQQSNSEHVVAKKTFAVADREPALVLPAHVDCNAEKAAHDERLAQLVQASRGEYPSRRAQKVDIQPLQCENLPHPITGVRSVQDEVVWMWVQGFHAALYGEYLPRGTRLKAVSLPFTRAAHVGQRLWEIEPSNNPWLLREIVLRNRFTRSTDSVLLNNGRVRYECVWIQLEDGRWGCVFFLVVAGLELLVNPEVGGTGFTAGFYKPVAGRPRCASKHSPLVFSIMPSLTA
ncbi:MAG: hypothetical protein KF768_14365 [Phycisphaeraceae bacterium]|nr:hypothetical protein [Phycisphaeraceae bacterium]